MKMLMFKINEIKLSLIENYYKLNTVYKYEQDFISTDCSCGHFYITSNSVMQIFLYGE